MTEGNAVRRVQAIRKETEDRLKRSGLVVMLMGSSGRGLDERRAVAHVLTSRGIVALVPEDDFSPEIGPSVIEEDVLERSDVDLVFLSIESWGAATEFGQFSSNPESRRNSGSWSDRSTTRSTAHPGATSPIST